MQLRKAFTLVELLVVITIIVVLISLLTPGLDRAIYMAELAACGADVRNVGQAALTYALDYGRRYPPRAGVAGNWQPITVQRGGTAVGDDRKQLRGYLQMGRNGQLNCPLNGKIDVENSHPDTWILVPYALYFGWQFYKDGVPVPGMNRMGSDLVWKKDGQAYRFNLLAADDSLVIRSDNWGHATHPDDEGIWARLTMQDESLISGSVPTSVTGPTGYKATLARYTGPPAARGTVDLNFSLQDGSVERISRVDFREGAADDPYASDPRIVSVPYTSQSNENTNYYRQLPLWRVGQ